MPNSKFCFITISYIWLLLKGLHLPQISFHIQPHQKNEVMNSWSFLSDLVKDQSQDTLLRQDLRTVQPECQNDLEMIFSRFDIDFKQSYYKREVQSWDSKIQFDLMIRVNAQDRTEYVHVQYQRTMNQRAAQVFVKDVNLIYTDNISNQIESYQLNDCRSSYFSVYPLKQLSDDLLTDQNEYHYSFGHQFHQNDHFTKISQIGRASLDLQNPKSYDPCVGDAFEYSPHYDDVRQELLDHTPWYHTDVETGMSRLNFDLKLYNEEVNGIYNLTIVTSELSNVNLREFKLTHRVRFDEDVILKLRINVFKNDSSVLGSTFSSFHEIFQLLGLERRDPLTITVFIGSDVQIIKSQGGSGFVQLELMPTVKEIIVRPTSLLTALAQIGGLLALIQLKVIVRYLHLKCFEGVMRKHYRGIIEAENIKKERLKIVQQIKRDPSTHLDPQQVHDLSTTLFGDAPHNISAMQDHETADFKAFFSFDNFVELAYRVKDLEKEKEKKDYDIAKLRHVIYSIFRMEKQVVALQDQVAQPLPSTRSNSVKKKKE